MFDRQTKAGHLEFFLMFSNVFHCYLLSFSLSRSLTISLAPSFTLFQSIIESLLPCGTTFVFIPMLQSHTHTHSQDLTLTHSLTLSISHSITLDMLNKFCFNLYAQNSLSHSLSISHSHPLSHSFNLSFNHSRHAQLNKFCFHLYAQKSLFIGENCNGFFLPQHHPPLLV